jgi:hypothetical protein
MPGFMPGVHVFSARKNKSWMAGHRRAEATPFFERLCPAMTANISVRECQAAQSHRFRRLKLFRFLKLLRWSPAPPS